MWEPPPFLGSCLKEYAVANSNKIDDDENIIFGKLYIPHGIFHSQRPLGHCTKS